MTSNCQQQVCCPTMLLCAVVSTLSLYRAKPNSDNWARALFSNELIAISPAFNHTCELLVQMSSLQNCWHFLTVTNFFLWYIVNDNILWRYELQIIHLHSKKKAIKYRCCLPTLSTVTLMKNCTFLIVLKVRRRGDSVKEVTTWEHDCSSRIVKISWRPLVSVPFCPTEVLRDDLIIKRHKRSFTVTWD